MNVSVQYQNPQHTPQSSAGNNCKIGFQERRPANTPSKNLLQNEIQCLYGLLGSNCVTLATCVAQILHGHNNTWKKQVIGVLCFIKDYTKRTYSFRVYDLRLKKSVYEQVIPASLCLQKTADLLYTFDGMNCKVGISFVDQSEAETFCNHFHTKQADRQKKRNGDESRKTQHAFVSLIMDEVRVPSAELIQTPVSVPSSNKNTLKDRLLSKTLRLGRKKDNQLEISEPDPSTLVHGMHVAENGSFVTFKEQQKLFDEVLATMVMSHEDETYIRESVRKTGGLNTLFFEPTHNYSTGEQEISNYPPDLYLPMGQPNSNLNPLSDIPPPSSNNQQTSRNYLHPPNTSDSYIVSNQTTAPVIPPKSNRSTSDSTNPSVETFRTPPPRPDHSQNQKQNTSVPPLPPPNFPLEKMPNEPLTTSFNPKPDSFCPQIRGFDRTKLKTASQQPPTSSTRQSICDSMETYIINMLKTRRPLILKDDEDESSDSEWED